MEEARGIEKIKEKNWNSNLNNYSKSTKIKEATENFGKNIGIQNKNENGKSTKINEDVKTIKFPTFNKSKSTNALTDCDKRCRTVQPKSYGISSEKRVSSKRVSPENKENSKERRDGILATVKQPYLPNDIFTLKDRTKTVPICVHCFTKIRE